MPLLRCDAMHCNLTSSTGHRENLARSHSHHRSRGFLKLHFAGTRTFSATGLDKKERFLTRRFRSGLYKFFGSVAPSSGALPLVIDPFTGSQGANTFSVRDAKVRTVKAWVPVEFSDGENRWTITYLLRNDQERNDDRWRIDDIQDVRGMLLSDVLKRQATLPIGRPRTSTESIRRDAEVCPKAHSLNQQDDTGHRRTT